MASLPVHSSAPRNTTLNSTDSHRADVDHQLRTIVDMNESAWSRLRDALDDVSDAEIDWRPLPQANSINAIVRHLCIEAQWHLDALARGTPMPSEVTPAMRREIDAVAFDFRRNLTMLEQRVAAFLDTLQSTTAGQLHQRTHAAYGASDAAAAPHLIAYHQALHLTAHCGQIRMIRNLFRKTRGEPPRFFPDNPTYSPMSLE